MLSFSSFVLLPLFIPLPPLAAEHVHDTSHDDGARWPDVVQCCSSGDVGEVPYDGSLVGTPCCLDDRDASGRRVTGGGRTRDGKSVRTICNEETSCPSDTRMAQRFLRALLSLFVTSLLLVLLRAFPLSLVFAPAPSPFRPPPPSLSSSSSSFSLSLSLSFTYPAMSTSRSHKPWSLPIAMRKTTVCSGWYLIRSGDVPSLP